MITLLAWAALELSVTSLVSVEAQRSDGGGDFAMSSAEEDAGDGVGEPLTSQQFARLAAQQDLVIEYHQKVVAVDSFAGFWVDTSSVVHVRFVGEPPQIPTPNGLVVMTEKADFSLSELLTAQQRVSALVENAADPWVIASAVDEVANRVVLFTTDPSKPIPPGYQSVGGNGVNLVVVDPDVSGSEPTTIIRGGQGMANGCTAGFAVRAGIYRGMMTAGHPGCGDSSSNSQSGVPLCCVQQVGLSGGMDRSVYAISAGGHGVSRNIKVDFVGGTRAISGAYGNSAFYVGFVSEKFGNTSGHRQGQIVGTMFDPSYVAGVGYFLEMSTDVPSWSGDSGGPNFLGATAVGITSGCIYSSPATSCSPSEPSGNNRAIVGKIGAQIANLGSWTLYLAGTDGQ